MPIGSIISQPVANGITAAYRPVILRVTATKTNGDPVPPVVYCDIYFNNVFYKTLSKTMYEELNALNSEFQFDLQDAAQEYLMKYLAPNGGSNIYEAAPIILKAQCRFRSSGIDANGFIATEDMAPVQGTSSSDPVAGTGSGSNIFYIVNATLRHDDNQDLATHLQSYKTGTWVSDAKPLSHRPNRYQLTKLDSDYFPIIYSGANDLVTLILNYRNKGQNDFHTSSASVPAPCIAVSIEAITLDDAMQGEAYSAVIPLSGSAPFVLSDIIKPSWMTIAVVGSDVEISGTPAEEDVDDDIPVGFKVNNCSGASADFTDIINVFDEESCVAADLAGPIVFPDAIIGEAYNYTFNLTGNSPFTLDNVVKPSWMTIAIVGSQVQLTGTPAPGDDDTDVDISFDILNCADDVLSVSDIIDVTESGSDGFVVINANSTYIINSVTPAFYFIGVDSFPVNPGQSITGTHSGFSGVVSVNIIGSGGTTNIQLRRNNVTIETKSVTGAGTVNFTTAVFTSSEEIKIVLT